MSRFFRVLTNRWALAIIGFLALALVVWLLGPFIAFADYRVLEPVSARLVTILILLVLGLGLILLRQWRKRRADRRLLDEMGGESAGGNADTQSHVDSAKAEEDRILKERFEEAIKLLRQPKNNANGKVASLYELPWYIIIGPPGCGKTTALANSGIDFPLASELGQQTIGGIGGTRNCDWWISNEAVLIDTAGRYTTQDSEPETDRAAWVRFLDLLKRYRRRRPINGALVSFSMPICSLSMKLPWRRTVVQSANGYRNYLNASAFPYPSICSSPKPTSLPGSVNTSMTSAVRIGSKSGG